jgi:hypothetical protein
MSGFPAEWLARREPYDRRARNRAVLAEVAERFASHPSIAVVDLACGAGATLRAVSAALPRRQSWRLVDNDLSLLARVQQVADAETSVRAIPVDLTRDLEAALDGPVDLVATSAFLDLVSAEWIERLVTEIAARNLPLYAALSYDGRVTFAPRDALDATILAAFNRHQATDKGFGPALGPAAAAEAVARFERIGYAVVKGASDWALGPPDDLQAEILAGFAGAAAEVGVASGDIAEWVSRRRSLLANERSSLQVGHIDFFACPSGRR